MQSSLPPLQCGLDSAHFYLPLSRFSRRFKAVMVKALFILAISSFLCGCTSVSPAGSSILAPFGQAQNPAHIQTSVNLTEGNFTVVKTNLIGHSTGFSLLGFIPIIPPKFTKAMNEMYAKAEIQEGESKTLANMIVEHSGSYWILFSLPEVIVRADVVQFNPKAVTGTNTPASPVKKPEG
jgi:hypothetical protein